MANKAEYDAWFNMRARCSDPDHPKFPHYGARGITYDPAWEDFTSFLRDVGPRPCRGYSLERRDNDKGYTKDNCYWATREEQNNNRRCNVWLEVEGERKTLAQWSKQTGLHRSTIINRLRRGFTPEEAISRRTFYAGPKPHRPI